MGAAAAVRSATARRSSIPSPCLRGGILAFPFARDGARARKISHHQSDFGAGLVGPRAKPVAAGVAWGVAPATRQLHRRSVGARGRGLRTGTSAILDRKLVSVYCTRPPSAPATLDAHLRAHDRSLVEVSANLVEIGAGTAEGHVFCVLQQDSRGRQDHQVKRPWQAPRVLGRALTYLTKGRPVPSPAARNSPSSPKLVRRAFTTLIAALPATKVSYHE